MLFFLNTFFIDSSVLSKRFVHTNSNGFFYDEERVDYVIDALKVGTISLVKIPLIGVVLHSFYVDLAFRGKGYGSELLSYICQYIKKSQYANKVYVQPGPFELKNGCLVELSNNEKKVRLIQLCALYQRNGFCFIGGPTPYLMHILYVIAGLHENSSLLMKKIL